MTLDRSTGLAVKQGGGARSRSVPSPRLGESLASHGAYASNFWYLNAYQVYATNNIGTCKYQHLV